ncbi:MAG TPA: PEP-CTERM sorting domain-containing protein [Tepidisphaeraceae bacterium]|jgi:hypothetical protein|nr:PEP-CTERM sorting domain-containing protein [Tepidisphaeraceae bacterium]
MLTKSYSSRVTIALALGVFGAFVSKSHATVLLEDTLTAPDGTLFENHAPDIGNGGANWVESADNNTGPPTLSINTSSTPGTNFVETQGSERKYTATFTQPLAAGQTLTAQVNALQTGGNFFAGLAGYSLDAGAGNDVAFFGHVNGTASVWSLAPSETAATNVTATSDGNDVHVATLTYAYDTGAATLSLDGTLVASATLAAQQPLDRLYFDNNNGGDLRFGATSTTPAFLVTATPEPASIGLAAFAAIGLLARRRRI